MLKQLSARVWYMVEEPATDRPSLGYVQGDRYALAFEAGASQMHVRKFYDELTEKGLRLPDFTAVSHSHWDHTYGLWACRGVTIATKATNDILRTEAAYDFSDAAQRERVKSGIDIEFCYLTRRDEYKGAGLPTVVPAQMELSGGMNLELGGVTAELIPCAGPHSADAMLCLIPEDKVLFLGDADGKDLFGRKWKYDPTHPELVGEAIARIPHCISRLRPFYKLISELEFDTAIKGHWDDPVTKAELLKEMEAYL